ncbi:hypothetical protein XELAEV_18006205mg [Xenopus laevis]|uniref:GPI ethanolamine phosphate transferase 2 C-terminal domain-containing protein n=1 Tax=Xenopus laevis TaxID=8355 RepID=A0A974I3B8_XENLA|nr:hypothetical protein XELAEV_18006205mg [Xenopus laevis]
MKVSSSVLASCCLLIQVFGLVLFIRGFFPAPVRSQSRKSTSTDTTPEPATSGASSNWTTLPPPLFKKVVILLIDAIRQDFVYGPKGKEHMPYLTQLLEKGTTHSFIAKATAPTVTMPRIKALMTGSIPGFIDVVMNLNSYELLDDNVIWQAKQAGKRIVDNYVTKHLDDILKRNDWDMLILHYLGLDHIGHLTGPHSHLVGPKLLEMDTVLRKISVALMSKEEDISVPSLLVLCGDHGMSETGSHGGSSDIHLKKHLISSQFGIAFHMYSLMSWDDKYFSFLLGTSKEPEIVQQTDIAPTLAICLGLPISRNSLGTILSQTVEHKSMREQLRFFHLNGHQLCKLLSQNVQAYEKDVGVEQFKKAEKSHGNWIKLYLEGNPSETLTNLGKKVLKQYLEALKNLSSSLGKQIAEYDIYSMTIGAVIALEILFLLLLSIPNALSSRAEFDVPLSSLLFSLLFYMMCLVLSAIHVIVFTSSESMCFFCSISWILALGIIMFISALSCIVFSTLGKMLSKSPNKKQDSTFSGWSELDILLLIGTVGHVLSMGASSFIEEEHQTWYFLTNTLCLALAQEMCRKYFLVKKGNLLDSAQDEDSKKEGLYMDKIYDTHKKEMKEQTLSLLSQFAKHYEKWIALSSPWAILIICRLLRTLNQTGIQWIHRPDFGHWLTSSEHKAELSFLVAVCLVMIFILIQGRCSFVSKVALAFGLLGIYCYRAAIGHVLYPWQKNSNSLSKGIMEARFVYIFVLGILFTGTKDLLKSQVIYTDGSQGEESGFVGMLVFCLLVQTTLSMFIWNLLKHDAAQITIMHYWFGQAFFFLQGNSNTISTVDISTGFVGLENYVELPAIFLTVFVTYSEPFLWAIHLLWYLSSETNRVSRAVAHGCYCYAAIRSIPVTMYIILVTAFRYHLFIWSVFSPKLLYEAIHLFISAGVCVMFTAVDKNQVLKSED